MIKDTSAQDVSVKPTTNYKKPLIIVLTLLLFIVLCSQVFIAQTSASVSVELKRVNTATVIIDTLIRDVAASGKIVAANAPQVYSPERGFVDLKVKAGDKVQLGDVIATLESPELTNELKQQQSVLQRLHGEQQRKHLEARRQTLSLSKTLDMA